MMEGSNQMLIWAYILIVFLFVSCGVLAWYIWHLRNVAGVSPTPNDEEIERIKESYERKIGKLVQAGEDLVSLRADVTALFDKGNPADKIYGLHEVLVRHKVWQKRGREESDVKVKMDRLFEDLEIACDSLNTVRLLQDKVIKPFYDQLQLQDYADAATISLNINSMVSTVMKLIDGVDSINNINYQPGKQGLNLQLLNEEITEAEAVKNANVVTTLSEQTPQWARILKASLDTLQLDNRLYLLRGYRFDFKTDNENEE